MTKSTSVISVSETMAMLMRSMGKYVYYRLGKPESREAYRLAMKECISCVSSGLESLDMIKLKIEGHRAEADILYPKKFFDKNLDRRRSHNMAIDQALDIVRSLEARFITGHCDSEPRHYHTIGVYHEDESLFG